MVPELKNGFKQHTYPFSNLILFSYLFGVVSLKPNIIKKVVLLFSLVFFVSVLSQAQLNLSAKGGINIAKIKTDGQDPDGRLSAYLGVAHTQSVSSVENLFVQPEIILSFQGAEDIELTHLNIPVIARYFVADEVSIDVGPQIDLLLGGKNDAPDYLTTLDIGFAIGGSFNITDVISANTRYIAGLTNISENDAFDIFNRVFQVGVAVKINQ